MKTGLLIGALAGLLIGLVVHTVYLHIELHNSRVDTAEAQELAGEVKTYEHWLGVAAKQRDGPPDNLPRVMEAGGN